MVKNTHGGSGHKKFGRKFTNNSGAGSKLRISEDAYEKYAIVTKMCGNNNIHVHCLDNVARLCHIRGKFSGRRKKDNFVTVGTWILVGVREYDDATGSAEATPAASSAKIKLKECDLLEVYTSVEKEQLKNNEDENWDILTSHDTSVLNKDMNTDTKDDVRFTTEHDDELETLIQTTTNATNTIGNDEHINVDCI